MKQLKRIAWLLLCVPFFCMAFAGCGDTDDGGEPDGKMPLAANQTQVYIPTFEESDFNAFGWFYNETDPSLINASVGPLEGYFGNAFKGDMRAMGPGGLQTWVFGTHMLRHESCQNDKFRNLTKIMFDYTSTEDMSTHQYEDDLKIQLIFVGKSTFMGIEIGESIKIEFNIALEQTDTPKTFTYVIEDSTDPDFTQRLNDTIDSAPDLRLSYLQFGIFHGTSFTKSPFTPRTISFGNLVFETA